MKFLLLAAALASVHAEANPAFTYATGYHLPLAYATHAVAPVVYTAAAGCQNDAGAVVPCAHGGLVGVVPAAPVAAAEPAVEEARKKREATAEAEADPEAEAEAWLFYRTHGYWPVGYGHLAYSYATTALATTTATTAGRRGRQLPRLTLRLPLRPIPGCCTVATDSPTVGTTATATTTLPTLTSEAAATTLADLSLALEDKREGSYQRKIKIDSWNHVLISCFTFVQRVCQNIEIDNKKTLKKKK